MGNELLTWLVHCFSPAENTVASIIFSVHRNAFKIPSIVNIAFSYSAFRRFPSFLDFAF